MSEFHVVVNDFCPALTRRDAPVVIDLVEDPGAIEPSETTVFGYCPVGEEEPRAQYTPLKGRDFPGEIYGREKHGLGDSRSVIVRCNGCQRLPNGFTVSRNMRSR